MRHGSGGYGGVGVMEMEALWPEGNPLLWSQWVPICMSVPFVCVFAYTHIIHLLNNMPLLACMHFREHICAYCLSYCHVQKFMSIFTGVHVCVRERVRQRERERDRESCRGYSNKWDGSCGPQALVSPLLIIIINI